ncbi:MAG TPA: protein phosphatase 2C domain-containing protein [Myxococcota bacterium]|nr:protein phosphatase 2C domain-containing protein [Myxococcota bacterium]HOH75660.1 protein phosphatase 2C domain-containing protein [Myxococcota bacterium]HPV03862.1 protein phosphatase 2C domain-containing protein [Myxococcota bacterium]
MAKECRISAWAETTVGKVRKRNEDAHLILPERSFYLVADGMGGHKRGDLASQLCIDSVREFLTGAGTGKTIAFFKGLLDKPFDDRAVWERSICAAIEYANRRIVKAAMMNRELAGMGTTVVSAGFRGSRMFVTWCGDSRIYRFRAGVLSQVSEDHSLVNQYLKSGALTPEQARRFPHRNVILQALGLAEDFRYDWLQETVMSGDVFLLCSDGLNDMLTDDQIRDILSTALPSCGTDTGEDGAERDSNLLSEACHALVSAAMDHGGLDNITVMLLCVGPCEGQD